MHVTKKVSIPSHQIRSMQYEVLGGMEGAYELSDVQNGGGMGSSHHPRVIFTPKTTWLQSVAPAQRTPNPVSELILDI